MLLRVMDHAQSLHSMPSKAGRSVDLRPRHSLPNVHAAPKRSPTSRRGIGPPLTMHCCVCIPLEFLVSLVEWLLQWINALSQHTCKPYHDESGI